MLCTAVLNELCDDEEFDSTREKLLLGIFELSGMTAMTNLNEAYDKVHFNDNDLNGPVTEEDNPGVMNESENIFFDEESNQLVIFYGGRDNDTNPDEHCFATQVVKVLEEDMSVDEKVNEVSDGKMRLSGDQVMNLMTRPTSIPTQPTISAPTNVSFNLSLSRLSTPSTKERASTIINKFINAN